MAKLLFVAQPAMGHMNSLFTIAGKMKAKGHEIHFSCPAVKKAEDAIKANEFDYIKVRPALSSIGLFFLPLFSAYAETYFAMKQFFSGLDHYSSVYKQILEELRPDAVIADFSYDWALFGRRASANTLCGNLSRGPVLCGARHTTLRKWP